ncbi:hypothetical protein [Cryobacterium arcticum]|uniref:Uncharacterized protein n=1 Tax=Cryobacterium arcticum TaxID=670052 RepID=A0A318A1U8_9MICO|nr:hypothetical protein [Cryobacterium arcticum]PXA72795.1 hypothetical protein CTB96_01450 [Cryobacterium arcticum]
MHRITISGFGALIVTLVVSGCAASAADVEPSNVATPFVAGDDFLCDGLSIPGEALEDRVPLSAIDEAGRTALAEAVWDDGSPVGMPSGEGWYVATSTDDLVSVMRDVEVVADPVSPAIAPDREVQTVTWVDNATNLPPGWYGASSSRCALTVDLGDLTVPEVEFQSPPDPLSQELRLLVTEETCNGGDDAEGRIEVVSLDETDDQVDLILGVRPEDGVHTCPSNPATPFTVTLSEPLGAREVVDASLAAPRALKVRGPLLEALAAGSDCEQTPLMLRATPSAPTAGETVTVTTTPEHCPVTDALAGEVIVRLGTGDTPTGARIEKGSGQAVVVTIPSGLTGDGYLMLVPDRDCEDVLTTADCHYPFAEVTIEAAR